MSLKDNISKWNEGVQSFQAGKFNDALQHFSSIEEPSAKILFNMASCLLELKQYNNVVLVLNDALDKDRYLAIGYFLRGIAHFQNGNFDRASEDFDNAHTYLRNNFVIDYKQLGMAYRLCLCVVLHNRGLAYQKTGSPQARECLMSAADPELHMFEDHAVLLGNKTGNTAPLMTLLENAVFQPPKKKVDNLKAKKFMTKKSEVKVSLFNDKKVGFQGEELVKKKKEEERLAVVKSKGPPPRPAYSAAMLKNKAVREVSSAKNVLPTHKVVYDYDIAHDGDLELREGDLIRVTKDFEDGWFQGVSERTKQSGVFPADYVEKYTVASPPKRVGTVSGAGAGFKLPTPKSSTPKPPPSAAKSQVQAAQLPPPPPKAVVPAFTKLTKSSSSSSIGSSSTRPPPPSSQAPRKPPPSRAPPKKSESAPVSPKTSPPSPKKKFSLSSSAGNNSNAMAELRGSIASRAALFGGGGNSDSSKDTAAKPLRKASSASTIGNKFGSTVGSKTGSSTSVSSSSSSSSPSSFAFQKKPSQSFHGKSSAPSGSNIGGSIAQRAASFGGGALKSVKPSSGAKPPSTVKPSDLKKAQTAVKPPAAVKPSDLKKPPAAVKPSDLKKPPAAVKPSDLKKPTTVAKPPAAAKPALFVKPPAAVKPASANKPPALNKPPSSAKPAALSKPPAASKPADIYKAALKSSKPATTGSSSEQAVKLSGTLKVKAHLKDTRCLMVDEKITLENLTKAIAKKFEENKVYCWYKPAPVAPLLRLSDQSHLDFLKTIDKTKVVVWCSTKEEPPA